MYSTSSTAGADLETPVAHQRFRLIATVFLAVLLVGWVPTARAASLLAIENLTPALYRIETGRPQERELVGLIAEVPPGVGTLVAAGSVLYAFVTADSAILTLRRKDASTIARVTLDTPLDSHPRGADVAPDGRIFGIFGERGRPSTFELRTIDPISGMTQLVGPIRRPGDGHRGHRVRG